MLPPRLLLLSGIAAALIVALLLFLGPCRRRPLPPGKPAPALELKKDEKAKVVIDTRSHVVKYSVRKSSGVIESRTITEARHATVVVKEDGEVVVTAKRWGFCLEPGLALAFDQGPRPAGDLRYFYFGNWGANVGLYHRDFLRLYFAGSYELGKVHLFNTSLWAGINLQKDITFGFRVGF